MLRNIATHADLPAGYVEEGNGVSGPAVRWYYYRQTRTKQWTVLNQSSREFPSTIRCKSLDLMRNPSEHPHPRRNTTLNV